MKSFWAVVIDLAQEGGPGQDPGGDHAQGVAVGLGLGQQLVHEHPAAAGLVDHHDGFGKIGLGQVGQLAGADVGGPAAAVGDQKLDLLLRISGQGRADQSQG